MTTSNRGKKLNLVHKFTIIALVVIPTSLTGFGKAHTNRPSSDEVALHLNELINSHGPNFWEKIFGVEARRSFKLMGGIEKVARALSESKTIEDFGNTVRLTRSEVEHLRSTFLAAEGNNVGTIRSLGIRSPELEKVLVFLKKLTSSGFID